MPLFQYVIFLEPNNENKEVPEKAKILVDVKTIVAASDRQAGILASRDIPEEYIDRLEEVNVAVRPF